VIKAAKIYSKNKGKVLADSSIDSESSITI
jgi:hypothetical protein